MHGRNRLGTQRAAPPCKKERSRHHSKRPTRHAGAAWTRNAGPTHEKLDLDTAWWVGPMKALSLELRRAQLPHFLVQDDYGQILEWSGV